MTSQPEAPSAAQWPDLSLWPDDDAPPLEWARFYRDHCGWIVLPAAGPMDVLCHARSIAVREAADYAVETAGRVDAEIPREVEDDIWDRAREEAGRGLGRPIGYVYNAWMKSVAVAADVTDDMLREAWEPLEG